MHGGAFADKASGRGLLYKKMTFENWIGDETGLSTLVFVLAWLVLYPWQFVL
jgi:hypothetical protein